METIPALEARPFCTSHLHMFVCGPGIGCGGNGRSMALFSEPHVQTDNRPVEPSLFAWSNLRPQALSSSKVGRSSNAKIGMSMVSKHVQA